MQLAATPLMHTLLVPQRGNSTDSLSTLHTEWLAISVQKEVISLEMVGTSISIPGN